ncbi:Hypothetical predicted protein, partial [Mytilus galloprovincialis]
INQLLTIEKACTINDLTARIVSFPIEGRRYTEKLLLTWPKRPSQHLSALKFLDESDNPLLEISYRDNFKQQECSVKPSSLMGFYQLGLIRRIYAFNHWYCERSQHLNKFKCLSMYDFQLALIMFLIFLLNAKLFNIRKYITGMQ